MPAPLLYGGRVIIWGILMSLKSDIIYQYGNRLSIDDLYFLIQRNLDEDKVSEATDNLNHMVTVVSGHMLDSMAFLYLNYFSSKFIPFPPKKFNRLFMHEKEAGKFKDLSLKKSLDDRVFTYYHTKFKKLDLDASETGQSNSYIRDIRGRIDRHQRDLNSLYCNLMLSFQELSSKVNGQSLGEQIFKIIDEGFYSIHRLYEDHLELNTPHIVLSEKDPAKAINYSVPMGQYRVLLWFQDMHTQIKKGKDNILVDGGIHPFCSRDGYLCYGNQREALLDCYAKFDIYGVLKLTQIMLTVYKPAGPYIQLYKFREKYERMLSQKNGIKKNAGSNISEVGREIDRIAVDTLINNVVRREANADNNR